MSLFRQEALSRRNRSALGDVIVRREPSSWMLFAIVLLLFAVALLVLGNAHLNRKVTAQGILVPSNGTASIQPTRPGVVEKLLVREGQFVRVNQPIAYVRYDQADSSGMKLSERIRQDLNRSEQRLNHQLALSQSKIQSISDQSKVSINGLRTQLNNILSIQNTQRQRLILSLSNIEAYRKLSKRGFVSSSDMRRQEAEHLSQQQANFEVDQRVSEIRTEILRQKEILRQAALDGDTQRDDIERQRLEIKLRLGDADRETGELILARISGNISALQADPGSLVTVDRPIAMIVQPGAHMDARLYVPSESIGFIEVGQLAKILFDAYPYQHYGLGEGVVTSVSAYAIPADRVAAPVHLEGATYRVSVRVSDENLHAYGKRLKLMPGMSLTAEIVQDRRSVAQWLLDPILSIRGRLF